MGRIRKILYDITDIEFELLRNAHRHGGAEGVAGVLDRVEVVNRHGTDDRRLVLGRQLESLGLVGVAYDFSGVVGRRRAEHNIEVESCSRTLAAVNNVELALLGGRIALQYLHTGGCSGVGEHRAGDACERAGVGRRKERV